MEKLAAVPRFTGAGDANVGSDGCVFWAEAAEVIPDVTAHSARAQDNRWKRCIDVIRYECSAFKRRLRSLDGRLLENLYCTSEN
jgi:hypothetical protein